MIQPSFPHSVSPLNRQWSFYDVAMQDTAMHAPDERVSSLYTKKWLVAAGVTDALYPHLG
jgi:hypothetical protein